ncbi:MAG: histidine kinase [Kiritimatiellaeota bacterium]|nr:histidine kinase [Kiritimatiellota bacterium]
MNAKQNHWSRLYQTALSKHLKKVNLRPALELGCQAATLGLETLDVARIHEQILVKLVAPGGSIRSRQKAISRAERFFAEAIVPIEKTHSAALQTDVRVQQLSQTLRRRTVESSASTRHLEQGIVRRQAAETALTVSGKHRLKLLQEARALQQRLLVQTRKMLAAQETERQKNSHQLHDEIAQILLAIHVRLLTLKTSSQANTENLKKEIAETQRLVKQSAMTIQRLAHEHGAHHAT